MCVALAKSKSSRGPAFVEPQGLIVKEGARVMSLQDGTAKMSKSAENDNTRINLLDSPDLIAKKLKRCKSDTIIGVASQKLLSLLCTGMILYINCVGWLSRHTR